MLNPNSYLQILVQSKPVYSYYFSCKEILRINRFRLYLFIYGVNQESKLKVIKYAESEFHTFEFVICKFNVVYI